MALATVMCLSLIFAAMCAAAKDEAPLVCNLKAISAEDRPIYKGLKQRLQAAVIRQSEVPDGYTYLLDSKKASLPEVAQWITMERLCCPFLTFRLDVERNGDTSLTLRGPEGVKAILREEFPQR